MARKFGNTNVKTTQTIFGVGAVEIDMVSRLNQMIVNQNTGHTGSVIIGKNMGLLGHSNQVMPAIHNFQSPSILRAPGDTRGQRAGANKGLPDVQPPIGIPSPMRNLLLPVGR